MPPKPKQVISEDFIPTKDELPHLWAFPWYKWSWDFFNCRNKNSFLCAGNQLSKSSTLIRKMIHWSTEKKLWKKLWKTDPIQMWIFYPTKDTATTEFDTKWVPEFLPRGRAKQHPVYGWEERKEYGKIHSIKFNSGVTIYFKSYAQAKTDIQASTVHFIGCDEELPVDYWAEINARRFATDGYFSMVFTPTLSQLHWFETMECIGQENERFKDAFKITVSMFDCEFYKNRRKSPWTKKRVQEIIDSCQSEPEVQRRVHGKFIREDLALVNSFDINVNYKSAHFISPAEWLTYLGVFIKSNRAYLCVVSASPNHQKLVVKQLLNVSSNPVESLVRIKQLPYKFNAKYINFMARDFINMANSAQDYYMPCRPPKMGLSGTLNGLFKTKMLEIAKSSYSNDLMTQISTVTESDLKDYSGYEFYGSLVMALAQLPLDFKDKINGIMFKTDPYKHLDERERHHKGLDNIHTDFDSYDEEFKEFSSNLEC